MNIVHIRERIGWMLDRQVVADRESRMLLAAPLFVHRRDCYLTKDEQQWMQENVCDVSEDGGSERWVPRLPFPAMIVHETFPLSVDSEGREIKDAELDIYVLRHDPQKVRYYFTIIAASLDKDVIRADFNNRQKQGAMIRGWFPDGSLCESITERDGHNYKCALNNTAIFLNTVMALCFDVFSKTNVTVRVTPPPKAGKSVQWVESRTHYLVLPPRVAAACATGKRGPSQQEITRAAHWRRAHIRKLMSPRFTHKHGQLVAVKHAWVGPIEWQGEDKKIYSLVHLDNQGQPMKGGV